MCEKYNGWTNRETWAVNLWIENTYGLHLTARGLADEADGVRELSDQLQNLIEELFDYDSVKNNHELILMLTDIGSLYRVNWAEIAREMIKELEEASA